MNEIERLIRQALASHGIDPAEPTIADAIDDVMAIIGPEGMWQCGGGHMFAYAPPPASPPWCKTVECTASDFVWILKDEVTSRDWPV